MTGLRGLFCTGSSCARHGSQKQVRLTRGLAVRRTGYTEGGTYAKLGIAQPLEIRDVRILRRGTRRKVLPLAVRGGSAEKRVTGLAHGGSCGGAAFNDAVKVLVA